MAAAPFTTTPLASAMSSNSSTTISQPEVDESAPVSSGLDSKERDNGLAGGKDPYQVVLDPSEDPQNRTSFKKWLAVVVISCGSLCATSASSVVRVFSS